MNSKILFLTSAMSLMPILGQSQGVFFYNPGNGHYYQPVHENISWPDARDAAASSVYLGLPGHLLTITSQAENDFIYYGIYLTVFRETWSGADSDWVWLGGYQPPGSIEPWGWTWVTGEAFDFSNWDFGQPSDRVGAQNFLSMWTGGRWNDLAGPGFGGISVAGYIVEYEPVPEPLPAGMLLLGAIAFFCSRARRIRL